MRFPSIQASPTHHPVTGEQARLGSALHLGVMGQKSPFKRRWLRLHLAGTGQTALVLSLLAGCAKACPCAESGGTRQGCH